MSDMGVVGAARGIEMKYEIGALRAEMNERFDYLDKRIDAVETAIGHKPSVMGH